MFFYFIYKYTRTPKKKINDVLNNTSQFLSNTYPIRTKQFPQYNHDSYILKDLHQEELFLQDHQSNVIYVLNITIFQKKRGRGV